LYRCSEQSLPIHPIFDKAAPLGHNALQMSPSGQAPHSIAPAPSAEEAAAIVAAVERFMRATTGAPVEPPRSFDPWQRAAILEGVSREPQGGKPSPWINT
jgi:hypothetical protein